MSIWCHKATRKARKPCVFVQKRVMNSNPLRGLVSCQPPQWVLLTIFYPESLLRHECIS